MAERRGERPNVDQAPDLIPRVPTAAEVKQMVDDVIKMQREQAERRLRLGIPQPEAPGLTPESRNSHYNGDDGTEDDLGSITAVRQLTVRGNVGI